MLKKTYQVLIVGYGLVGNIAALLLAKEGIQTAILEKQSQNELLIAKTGRLDGESMRILRYLGLGKALEKVCHPLKGTQVLDTKGKVLFELGHPSSSYLSPVYGFYQPDLQQILQKAVDRSSLIDVYTETQVEAIELEDEKATLILQTKSNHYWEFSGDYVLVCNGQDSDLVELLGLEFKDYRYGGYTLNVDTLAKTSQVPQPFAQNIYNANIPVTRITNNTHHQRWEFQLDKKQLSSIETSEQLQMLFKKLGAENMDIQSSVVHRFSSKILKNWQVEQIFFLGDAAHVMPPYLGLGLSEGIKDIQNLVWKLRAHINGKIDKTVLKNYTLERAESIKYLIRLNLWVKRFFRSSWWRWLRIFVPILPKRFLKRSLDMRSMIRAGIIGDSKDGVGRFFVDLKIQRANQKICFLDDITMGKFTILAWRTNPVDALAVGNLDLVAYWQMNLIKVLGAADQLEHERRLALVVQDHTKEMEEWRQKKQAQFVILRPDALVYDYCSNEHELNNVLSQLEKQLATKELVEKQTI
ncbi:MAG: FAD-dependent monooxygenase [Saprospiraceae bacterium]|nr:FAD-dependent monooxygenase [Saprospiraceae bacterium]